MINPRINKNVNKTAQWAADLFSFLTPLLSSISRTPKAVGIKAVIASSFGDIFYNNCFKNNVLPIKLKKIEIDALFKKTKKDILEISIDLQKKEINLDQEIISFKVDNHLINRIIYKLDDIDITLKEKNKIYSFEKERIKNRPWIYEND